MYGSSLYIYVVFTILVSGVEAKSSKTLGSDLMFKLDL